MLLMRIESETGLFVTQEMHENFPVIETGDEVKNDPQYIDVPVPDGFYWPKWNGTEWVEGGEAPAPVPKEPTETEVLQAQLKASNDYMDFLEECVVEMAQVVYK